MIGEISTPKVSRDGNRTCTDVDGMVNSNSETTSVDIGARFDALRAPQHPARAAAETTAEGRGGLLLVRKKSDSYRTTYFARVVAIRCENSTRELG